LRQAYDYWQDQPGNYFPTRFRGHRLTHVRQALAFTMWSSSTFYVWTHRSLRMPSPKVRSGVQPSSNPRNGVTSFPVLARLKQDPPVPIRNRGHPPLMRTTRRPATPERLTRSWRIPKCFDRTRFDHRQATHLLQTSPKPITQTKMAWGFKGNRFPPNHQGQSSSSQPPCVAGPFDAMQDDLVNHQTRPTRGASNGQPLEPPFNLEASPFGSHPFTRRTIKR